MFKLDFKKTEESEIKLPTSVESSKKARKFQKSIYFCFIDYAKAFDCVDHNKLWNILKEMGIANHLTCPLRNLYAGQKAIVRTLHGTTDWFQIGKGVCQGCILSPCLFNFNEENIRWNAELKSRFLGEISTISGRQMTPPLWKKAKILSMKVKEESEKAGLKFNIQNRGNQNWRRHVHPNVHRSTVYNSQDTEAT